MEIVTEWNKELSRWEMNAYKSKKPMTLASMTKNEIMAELKDWSFSTDMTLSQVAQAMLTDKVCGMMLDHEPVLNGKMDKTIYIVTE